MSIWVAHHLDARAQPSLWPNFDPCSTVTAPERWLASSCPLVSPMWGANLQEASFCGLTILLRVGCLTATEISSRSLFAESVLLPPCDPNRGPAEDAACSSTFEPRGEKCLTFAYSQPLSATNPPSAQRCQPSLRATGAPRLPLAPVMHTEKQQKEKPMHLTSPTGTCKAKRLPRELGALTSQRLSYTSLHQLGICDIKVLDKARQVEAVERQREHAKLSLWHGGY